MSPGLRLVLPGRTDYRRCYALQRQLADELVADRSLPGALIVTEHEPVITLGRTSRAGHVLADSSERARRGVGLVETDRGGDVTWHGPGQLVLYPVVPLEAFGGRDLGRFLRALEACVIRTLKCFGIEGRREAGMSGVWTDAGKICALGAAFRRWVSYHGLALNLDPEMDFFRMIVPCGLHGRRVTSMREVLGEETPDRTTVERALIGEFCSVFGVEELQEVEVPLPSARDPLGGRRDRRSRRHPPWLVKRLPAGGERSSRRVGELLDGLELNTVCRSANCPNLGECFAHGTATFLVMGPNCTRACRFCSVPKGGPQPLDPGEPSRVAEAAARLGLSHVVVTSVTRDDLPDGGAAHFVEVVRALRRTVPGATVELLVPDFAGSAEALRTVMNARPDVLNHNVETVPRLYPSVRAGADYRRSLELLSAAKRMSPDAVTKSGLMVGLGEEREEVIAVLRDLAAAGVGAVTVGQYLAPTPGHQAVAEYVRPEVYEEYAREARAAGIVAAACGPWVRSSYRAEGTLAAARTTDVEGECAPT